MTTKKVNKIIQVKTTREKRIIKHYHINLGMEDFWGGFGMALILLAIFSPFIALVIFAK